MPEEFQPPLDDTCIWRYMAFAKYLDILKTGSLFFPSARSLLLYDQYEGSVSALNKATERTTRGALGETDATRLKVAQDWQSAQKEKRLDWTFISCWHQQKGESAAMWKIYGESDYSVAIRSTVGALWEAAPTLHDLEGRDFCVPPTGVRYVDFDLREIDDAPSFAPYLFKYEELEYEHEVRVIVQQLGAMAEFFKQQPDGKPNKTGIPVDVNLPGLIKEVVTSPRAPSWFTKLTEQATKDEGLPDVTVRPSKLSRKPIY